MPATVTDDPLGIVCVFSDGSRAEFSFEASANPRLARDLLVGLVELIHPHGSVDAAGTVQAYALALRNMDTTLAGWGFTGGAGALTRGRLAEYWMGTTSTREACTRRMLEAFDTATGGLADGVREFVAGRYYNQQPNRRPLPPYREGEWSRLSSTCRLIVDEAFAAHRGALAAAARGQHPRTGGWTEQNLRWLLARIGPVSTIGFGRQAGCSDQTIRRRGGFGEASTQMFPHLDVVIAYQLLFGIYSGIVPDGIADLVVDDIDWAGDASILLSYVKGRTAAEGLTLPRKAVRLLEQWLAHSALLRGRTDPGHGPAPVDRGEPGRQRLGVHRRTGPHGHPKMGDPLRRDRRRRRPTEDSPVSDPDHAPLRARHERVGRAGAGDHRPQPHPASGRRPLPDRHDPGPAAGCRGHR
jgi:hypothetical protein